MLPLGLRFWIQSKDLLFKSDNFHDDSCLCFSIWLPSETSPCCFSLQTTDFAFFLPNLLLFLPLLSSMSQANNHPTDLILQLRNWQLSFNSALLSSLGHGRSKKHLWPKSNTWPLAINFIPSVSHWISMTSCPSVCISLNTSIFLSPTVQQMKVWKIPTWHQCSRFLRVKTFFKLASA